MFGHRQAIGDGRVYPKTTDFNSKSKSYYSGAVVTICDCCFNFGYLLHELSSTYWVAGSVSSHPIVSENQILHYTR
jgi:hypothetical protein